MRCERRSLLWPSEGGKVFGAFAEAVSRCCGLVSGVVAYFVHMFRDVAGGLCAGAVRCVVVICYSRCGDCLIWLVTELRGAARTL